METPNPDKPVVKDWVWHLEELILCAIILTIGWALPWVVVPAIAELTLKLMK